MADGDIVTIIAQEQGLVFEAFSEETAFAIGSAIRARGVADGLSLVVDVRLWDRPLFYCALPGTSGDNPEWCRRKAYLVQRFGKSSYRMLLENKGERLFPANRALEPALYALSGGAFPIRVKGTGVVGAITLSGLAERADHMVAVEAICDHLGVDRETFALPNE